MHPPMLQGFAEKIRNGKTVFLLFVGTALAITLRTQAQLPEFEKYARIKQRLNESFVKVGPLPGESIPAGRLYKKWDSQTQRKYSTLEFGDATIHLGWYLAVLATEHHLLRKQNKSTDENSRELYYALHAIERLDINSNVAWSYWEKGKVPFALYDTVAQQWIPKHPISLLPDGFLLRDDVPPYFYRNFRGVEMNTSDFTQHQNPRSYTTPNLGGEESKDQLVSLLMGLFFVHRYVTADAQFNGKNLRDYNRTLSKTLVDYVRYERLNKLGAWKISNPEKNGESPRLGYDPVLFAYPIAAIANEIVYNKRFDKRPIVQHFKDSARPTYQNGSSLLSKPVFIRLRESKVVLDKRHDWHINYYMIFLLASVSNAWSNNLPYQNNAVDLLKQRCSDAEAKGWLIYPLMNEALYPDGPPPYEKAYVERELALYPENGSYNYFNTQGDSLGKYTHHWFSSNRFQSSNGHYEGNPEVDCNSYFNGAFNGLDYLLLYNLYRVVYADELVGVDYKSRP